MRAIVAVAALAVGGAALVARAPEPRLPAAPAAHAAVPACEPSSQPPRAASPVERVSVEVAPTRLEARPREAKAGTYGPEAVLAALDRELEMTPGQRVQAQAILDQRQEEIDRCHREIRASGVFRPREWEARVGDILSASYARIGALLDRRQHARFGELVARRGLADPVEFEPEPHLVVLD